MTNTNNTAENEIVQALQSAIIAIDVLIAERPMLAVKVCGSTTLGNQRAEIKAVLTKLTDGKEF